MIKKRGMFFIIIIFLILIVGIFFIGFVSSQEKEKISEEVYKNLEKSNEIRVIITLKEPSTEKGFLIKTQKTNEEIALEKQEIKEEIINNVGEENVKHAFDKEISVEISKDELDELNKNPNVESVKSPKKIYAFLQQSVPYINASLVWPIQISNVNITGIDETVCIIDTGINFLHPDLLGKNKTCVINCITEDCVKNCSIGDDNGHGTHVAGIVAASGGINGVGININLIGVKVLDSDGEGNDDDLNAGINWCIANKNAYNISVISMSLGDCSNHSTYCNDFSSASFINNATAYNISVIVAAGNGPGGSCGNTITNINGPAAPACVENATAVGAVNDADSSISYQRGALFELLAPGVSINSTVPTGSCELCASSGYKVASGTSMSTPHVAGAFALIRQFFRLQNNRVPTPAEIKTTLNNTGKRIFDSSGTGLNFSRIDVYSALISLDNQAPNISLISPQNNTSNSSTTQTFKCNASDAVGLKNITLKIWDSLGNIYYNYTNLTSGMFSEITFNTTLNDGNYKWNCLAYDYNNNFAYASSNFSLYNGNISVSLNSPLNNYFTNQNQTNFACLSQTTNIFKLTNVTFMLWNSSSLVNSSNLSISGTSNLTTFQYNFTLERNYTWNCLAYNNASQSAFASSNYSITYDITKPNINLISPANSAAYSSDSQQITFQYNVSDIAIANCSLLINNSVSSTNTSITNFSAVQTFTQTFTPYSYSWQINCTDAAGNQENSSSRSFTITAPQIITISSSSGGGTTPSYDTYIPTSKQALQGYTKELEKDDIIKFNISKNGKEEEHTLTIKTISSNSVNLAIQSSLIEATLSIGEEKKFNLTSSEFYDVVIKLNSINNQKANLTLKVISEQITAPINQTKKEPGEITTQEDKKEKPKIEIGNIKNIIIITLGTVILIIVIFILFYKKMMKEINKYETIEKYRENFKKHTKTKK